ncbi:MAG: RNA ligase family protein [Nanoarchaeota archaeon]
MTEIKDMQKLESPFVRTEIDKEYIVTSYITEGYKWVFEDPEVIATEKLDGTNVSIVVEDGIIKSIWNRENRIQIFTGDWRINEALVESAKKGCIPKEDGQHFGEVIGPNVNGNPYKLDKHIWLPLKYIHKHYYYTSWGKYPKTFEAISEWFEKYLFSIFLRKRTESPIEIPIEELPKAEGVVFVHPDGRIAKLRRDMFSWFKGSRHKEIEK